MNDRLDLTQVEALGDILTATTEQQRRIAIRGTSSEIAKRYDTWRAMLLYARGELEALIDFSEDQHFDESPVELASSVASQVYSLAGHIEAHLANAMRGELLRNGISLALLGAPNAGKSSLLNCIVGRDAAIVSSEAGTTRDVVEVGLDLGGYYCKFGDMAGLRRSAPSERNPGGVTSSSIVGAIEQEGIKRAKQRALAADVVVVVCSVEQSTEGTGGKTLWRFVLDEEVLETAKECVDSGANVVVVVNKIDLIAENDMELAKLDIQKTIGQSLNVPHSSIQFVSCKEAATFLTPQSKDPGSVRSFLGTMITLLKEMTDPIQTDPLTSDPLPWQESLGATERHRLLLSECLSHLNAFIESVSYDPSSHFDGADKESELEIEIDIVAAAECLRVAADCLGKITGKGEAGDVEEVLGVVFEK